MYQDAQFVVVGRGLSKGNTQDPSNKLTTCDPVISPILVLNTSNYTWQTHFDPNAAAYAVPDAETSVIGGEYV